MDAQQRQQFEDLLRINQRRLFELEKQAAFKGSDTLPHVRIEIDDVCSKIAQLTSQLGAVPLVLPAPVLDFIGRDVEVTQLVHALKEARIRGTIGICAIRGMGGLGKTQLALAIAQRLAPDFPDGQVLLDLRGASDAPVSPQYALQSVIRAFNPTAILVDDLGQLMAAYHTTLRGKHVLILADDAGDVNAVRPLIPPSGCAFLITSRMRFALEGMGTLDLATLSAGEAERLLLAICPRLGDTAPQLARLCGYLPLALRVSASLLATDDSLPISEYLAQLSDLCTRLSRLRNPDDDGYDVEASLRLSYNSLAPRAEQARQAQLALCQLSIFPASFDISAAEAIIAVDEGVAVREQLLLLRRRSLLEWDALTQRYHLHDLVRAFAAAHLATVAQTALQQRYPTYYLTLAEQDAPALSGPPTDTWVNRLEAEHANLRAALSWAFKDGDVETGVRLVAVLWWFWYQRGYLNEGRAWLARLDTISETIAPSARARACYGAGWLAWHQGDFGHVDAVCTESLGLYRALNDKEGMAWAQVKLGDVARLHRCDPEQAMGYYRASLALFYDLEHQRGIAYMLHNLGLVARFQGAYALARSLMEESLAKYRALSDPWGITRALTDLGRVLLHLHDRAAALQTYREGLAMAQSMGDMWFQAYAVWGLGRVYASEGDVKQAYAHYLESLGRWRELGDRIGITDCLSGLAELATRAGQWIKAAQLLGTAENFQIASGACAEPAERAEHDHLVASIRNQLGEAAFATAWAEGPAHSWEQAELTETFRAIVEALTQQPLMPREGEA